MRVSSRVEPLICKSNEDYLMKARMQNESMRLDRPDSRVEPKVMAGLQTFMGISEQGLTSFTCPKEGLLEFILSPANMNAAYKKVKSNKSSGGIDGMSTEALLAYLKKHGSEFIASLLEAHTNLIPFAEWKSPRQTGRNVGLASLR